MIKLQSRKCPLVIVTIEGVFRVSPKMEVNTEAPKVSLLREQFEQAQFIKDRFLVPPEMARRSQEESIKKVTVDRLPMSTIRRQQLTNCREVPPWRSPLRR